MALGFVVLFASAGANSKEKTLYDFRGGSDGAMPTGGVIADQAGKSLWSNRKRRSGDWL